jgi:cytochrome c biogenesis protein ResB
VISSPRLAIALLVGVLACCVVGVTVFTGERAWTVIFTTLWFNGLLVLLALSSGLTFLARIWGRKLTLVSVGMIVFHVSFLALLCGVVVNGLFHFKGVLRLTEGETLPNGSPASYDTVETGRFFDFARLRGETTLLKMHRGYKVDGRDKRAAYEIAVGEGTAKTTGIIYVTQNLDHGGVRYLCSKEGYSVGVVLHDRQGREMYAAMVPLQSMDRGAGRYLYSTGSAQAPGSFPFPPPPDPPAFLLQVVYVPDHQQDRAGQVEFSTWSPSASAADAPRASGKVPVGGMFDAGDYQLEAREVRYWVGMTVRRDPGLTLILSSLWAGLAGMTMTFAGRIRQDARRRHQSDEQAVGLEGAEEAP